MTVHIVANSNTALFDELVWWLGDLPRSQGADTPPGVYFLLSPLLISASAYVGLIQNITTSSRDSFTGLTTSSSISALIRIESTAVVQRTLKCLHDTGAKPSLGYNVPKPTYQQVLQPRLPLERTWPSEQDPHRDDQQYEKRTTKVRRTVQDLRLATSLRDPWQDPLEVGKLGALRQN